MNEIELFEKIENSIHDGTYNELLNDSEKELQAFLSRYEVEDIMILINRIILFHNYNMFCKEYDYSKYQRDKHLSLRILLALPQYYCANVLDTEKIHIKDFDIVMEELIYKIIQLQSVYYYYPYRNEKNVIFDDDRFFYMNYFKSYYFDYPCMEIYEFLRFFHDNIELCKNVLGDEKFDECLNLMCYLQNIENNTKNENLWFKMKCGKAIRKSIKMNNIYILCSTKLIQRICSQKKFDYENIIKNYTYQVGIHNEDNVKIIDVLAKREDKRFLMMTSDFLYFPRNYYWMHQWYNKIWRSRDISHKLANGKTIKSQMHEDELYELLKQYFGERNIYANAYLRRAGRQYAEKDFIVLYKNVVLSFEAKSNLLPAPELEVTDSIDNLKYKCEECIKKAYAQSLEVKQSIASGKAVFYDSANKKNKVLIDLRNFKIEKCIQVVVMYEEYLGIETNIEHICPEFDAWIIDIKNLMYILADTVGKGDFATFVDYALKRKNAYGLIDVQSGEDGSDVRKRADQVFKYIIAPVCDETGFEPIRVDKLNQPDSITQTIIDYLMNSELVIADITGHNPNAFYEMGYRASTGKPIIHLKGKNEGIPFDIAGIRAFDYDLSDLDSVEEIKARLIKTIAALSFEEQSSYNESGEAIYKETNSDISQLVSILYEIQDEISQLKNEIHDKDTETIQAIVKASVPATPVEDSNTAIMKAVLPELLKNPNSIKALFELSESTNKKKR